MKTKVTMEVMKMRLIKHLRKERKQKKGKFRFCYSDTNEKEIYVYLDCCILRVYTTVQNNQQENFGKTIFLQGTLTVLQCL